MSQVGGTRSSRVWFRIFFFNLLRFIGIDIVQATMSVLTLYLFPFSSYMQKNKHVFGFIRECSSGKPCFAPKVSAPELYMVFFNLL